MPKARNPPLVSINASEPKETSSKALLTNEKKEKNAERDTLLAIGTKSGLNRKLSVKKKSGNEEQKSLLDSKQEPKKNINTDTISAQSDEVPSASEELVTEGMEVDESISLKRCSPISVDELITETLLELEGQSTLSLYELYFESTRDKLPKPNFEGQQCDFENTECNDATTTPKKPGRKRTNKRIGVNPPTDVVKSKSIDDDMGTTDTQDGDGKEEASGTLDDSTCHRPMSMDQLITDTLIGLEGQSIQSLYDLYFGSIQGKPTLKENGNEINGDSEETVQPKKKRRGKKVAIVKTDEGIHTPVINSDIGQKDDGGIDGKKETVESEGKDAAIIPIDKFNCLVSSVLKDMSECTMEEMMEKYQYQRPNLPTSVQAPKVDPNPIETGSHSVKRVRKPRVVKTHQSPVRDSPIHSSPLPSSPDTVKSESESIEESADHSDNELEDEVETTCSLLVSSTKNEEIIHTEAPPTLPGTWVECVKCGKWRFLKDVIDPSALEEAWHCGLQSKHNSSFASSQDKACAEPQEEYDDDAETVTQQGRYLFTDFTAGSLIWAKLDGYPEWPAMIDCDVNGRYADYSEETGEVYRYLIVFIDPKTTTTRQCVRKNRVRRFTTDSVASVNRVASKYRHRLVAAIQEAINAVDMPLEDRLFNYGYPYPVELSSTKESNTDLEIDEPCEKKTPLLECSTTDESHHPPHRDDCSKSDVDEGAVIEQTPISLSKTGVTTPLVVEHVTLISEGNNTDHTVKEDENGKSVFGSVKRCLPTGNDEKLQTIDCLSMEHEKREEDLASTSDELVDETNDSLVSVKSDQFEMEEEDNTKDLLEDLELTEAEKPTSVMVSPSLEMEEEDEELEGEEVEKNEETEGQEVESTIKCMQKSAENSNVTSTLEAMADGLEDESVVRKRPQSMDEDEDTADVGDVEDVVESADECSLDGETKSYALNSPPMEFDEDEEETSFHSKENEEKEEGESIEE